MKGFFSKRLVCFFCLVFIGAVANAQNPGSIDVTSSPDTGITILLDYFNTGQATNDTIGEVSPGSHAVSLMPAAGTPAPPPAEGLQVPDGGSTSASFTTNLGTRSVEVTVAAGGTPVEGAKVYLDYVDTGQTTDPSGKTILVSVTAGRHFVIVRHASYAPSGILGTDLSGTDKLTFDLKASGSPGLGSITVDSTPGGADVFLDYLSTGQTSRDSLYDMEATTLTDLGLGTHEVTVQRSGYLLPPPQTVELTQYDVATSVNFSLLAVATPTPTATPIPNLELVPSSTSVVSGDSFSLTLVLRQSITQAFDFYLLMEFPNGALQTINLNGSRENGIMKVASNVPGFSPALPYSRTIWSNITVPGGISGQFTFYAAVLEAGKVPPGVTAPSQVSSSSQFVILFHKVSVQVN